MKDYMLVCLKEEKCVWRQYAGSGISESQASLAY